MDIEELEQVSDTILAKALTTLGLKREEVDEPETRIDRQRRGQHALTISEQLSDIARWCFGLVDWPLLTPETLQRYAPEIYREIGNTLPTLFKSQEDVPPEIWGNFVYLYDILPDRVKEKRLEAA